MEHFLYTALVVMERVEPTMINQTMTYFVFICRKYNRPTSTLELLDLLVDLLVFTSTTPYRLFGG
jgi:hypothetical protein